ncbi:hypothetical protein SAMN04488500_102135 [Sporomusa malonica]|uniref:Uncharacterized protein n=1 Tax=Sporomusa malonica TaxID=112901 RepID=A0A1W1YS48_9FIRM|nr:hypothetical protein SAMN04488500_102135 [Sporomusa malonica]
MSVHVSSLHLSISALVIYSTLSSYFLLAKAKFVEKIIKTIHIQI